MSKDRFVSTGSRIKEEDRINGKTREMKDSGVEWIGEIPEDWEVKKLGNISSLYIGNSIRDTDKDNYMHPEDAIPYIATKDVSLNNKINYKNGMYIKNNDRDFRRAYKGSSLICIEGGSAGKKIAQVMTECCFGNKLCCVDSQVILNNFLYYYLLSPSFNNSFNARITGLIPGVTLSELGEIEVVVPTKDNQRKIANFLDGKVSLIDDTIEKTKQSIEDYKKYKQALITETVTKGLNPDVEMKDSGVEWIGEVPEHWEIVKLKNIGVCFGGIIYNPVDICDEDKGTLVLRSSNVQNGKLDFSDNVYVKTNISDKYITKRGDILVCSRNGSRNLIGKNALIDKDYGYTFGAFMTIVRTKYYKFVHYFLNSNIFDAQSSLFLTSTVNQLTLGVFNNMNLVLPSEEEQQQIVDYLDNKCSEIDKIISEKEQLVKDLEIYKKSLIYECVTGKRQV